MKNISKNRKSKKPLVIAIVAVIALVVAILAFPYVSQWFTTSTPSNTPDQSELDDKKDLIETPDNSTPPSNEPTDNQVVISVSRESDETVVVSTQLSDISNGECKLEITNGTRRYSADAEVLYQPSFSTCKGFTVPVTQLGVGTWQIAVSVISDGNTSNAQSQFEVK